MNDSRPIPTLDQYRDFSLFADAIDQERRDIAADAIDSAGAEYFIKGNPEYFATEKNARLLTGWCTARGVPSTAYNLTIAWRELRDSGQLETPREPATEPGPHPSITLSVSDRLAEYEPSAEERAALKKIKDDPNLSDAQRRSRDTKLRILARDQRLAIRAAGGLDALRSEEE